MTGMQQMCAWSIHDMKQIREGYLHERGVHCVHVCGVVVCECAGVWCDVWLGWKYIASYNNAHTEAASSLCEGSTSKLPPAVNAYTHTKSNSGNVTQCKTMLVMMTMMTMMII